VSDPPTAVSKRCVVCVCELFYGLVSVLVGRGGVEGGGVLPVLATNCPCPCFSLRVCPKRPPPPPSTHTHDNAVLLQ